MYLGLMIWPMLAFAWTFNIVEREPFKNGNLPVPGHQGNILISIDKFSYPDNSIKNNICLGNPKATLNQIEYVAKLACIHQDIINFPKNYHTKVGEQGIMLSGGQKQRIAIARALLFPSKILILDDAFSSVDNYIGHNILTNIKKLKHYYILIISTHKLSFLKESSEIFVLQHGKIKQHGSHHVLIKQQGWYSKIYQYQKFKYNPSSKED
uniref:ABC transporter domain-containing protein n=1 Tax=Glossina palpalis gambiensis TaxID=67801 RepID=A0A1B0AKS9_9MUSC